jgi:hypothetical protein
MRARSHNAAFVECWGVSCVGDAANFVGSSENRDLAAELRELATPTERGEKVPVIIDRARKASGLPYWRCWNIWYGKARHIAPEEYTAVAAALEKNGATITAQSCSSYGRALSGSKARSRKPIPTFIGHHSTRYAMQGGNDQAALICNRGWGSE